ncbi:MAG: hypothetical protein C5B54_12165, partial [Acidobacteria bacterium]
RIDSGFELGDVIPQEYDSLFAKFIAHASTREEVIRNLIAILDQTVVSGIITNKSYLRAVLAYPDFATNQTYTRWIEEHPELLKTSSEQLDHDLKFWAKKWSSELFVQRWDFQLQETLNTHLASHVPHPTSILQEFQPSEEHGTHSPQGLVRIAGWFTVRDERIYAAGWISRFELCITFERDIDGVGQRRIAFAGQFEVDDIKTHHGPIVAQVPGVVLDVRAKINEIIEPRTPILVVEAMKIEMPMVLPIAAKITAIHVRRGDRIQPGQTLVTWEPAA